MENSGYDSSHPTAKNHANGYRFTAGKYKPASFVNMTVPFSAGALYSTVLDLYKWDRVLDANSGKLIPKPLHKKMFTPQVPVRGELTKIEDASSPVHYGFGWFVKKEFGHLEYSHEGGIAGFTSLNSWFPKQHVYIIVLDNMSSPKIFDIGKDLAAIVFGEDYKIPTPFKAISLPAEELKKFVGTYQLTSNLFMYITREGDQLKTQLTGQASLPIYPESETHFFLKAVRAEIYFKTNDQGKVTGVVLHQGGRKISGKKVNPAKAPKPTSELKAISLPPEALQKFVGTYQ